MLKRLYLKVFFKLFPSYRLRRSGAQIGKNVFFGESVYVELENARLLKIGDGSVLSAFCKIILHDSSLNNVDNFDVLYGKVVIGKNVYIGSGSIILPGTEIGEGTIVGAGSLVKGVLRKNSVYAGNPIRYLSSVGRLKSKWRKRNNPLTFLKKMPKWSKNSNK